MKELQRQGYEVVAVAPRDEFTHKLIEEQIRVVNISAMERSGINPYEDYKLYKEYLKIYKELNPDIIFHFTIKPNIYGTIAAKKLNIPCIAIVTGLGYTFIHKGLITTVVEKMYSYSLSKASEVWFLNNDDKFLFESRHLVNPNKSQVINGEGIDTDLYNYEPIDTSKISFILVARLLYDKGLNEYYRAARKLKKVYPNVSFKLLGYLNVENPMAIPKKLIDEWVKSGDIDYLGSAPDVKPFVKNSTCVVLPSYREGISVSLMEGASMGRPLIASNIAGCKELIEDGRTGFLCNVKDADDLATKLERIINMDGETLKRMGQLSRDKIVENFSIKNILPRYEKALRDLAHKTAKQ